MLGVRESKLLLSHLDFYNNTQSHNAFAMHDLRVARVCHDAARRRV